MPNNLTVAFIGDSGVGSNFRKVLTLIKQQGADLVIHSGDLGYEGSKTTNWEKAVNDVLGVNFPYFASIGNHDSGWSTGYGKILAERAQRVGAQCSGSYGTNAACTYQGLFFLLSGGGEVGSEAQNTAYIQQQLAQDTSLWRICSWHHNQKAMQVGGKSDEVGWGPYEACREGGAIVATAHEHSYQRTHLLSNFQQQTVASTSNTLHLSKGKSFVFVSGLGGNSIRDQERCFPSTAPYGCKGEWASIYTSTQGANYGALFCTFKVNGVPNQASCYFMDIDGEVPDQFDLVSNVNN
jgi:predicted phosphodiesterase